MKKIASTLIAFAMIFVCFTAFFTAEAVTVDTDSKLYKKSVLFVGDSITYAHVEREANHTYIGWPGRIMAWNDMTGANGGAEAQLKAYVDFMTGKTTMNKFVEINDAEKTAKGPVNA